MIEKEIVYAVHRMLVDIAGISRLVLETPIGERSTDKVLPSQYELHSRVERLFNYSLGNHFQNNYENVSDENFIMGLALLLDEIHTITFRTYEATISPKHRARIREIEAVTKKEVSSRLRLETDACSSPIKPSPRMSSLPDQYPDK